MSERLTALNSGASRRPDARRAVKQRFTDNVPRKWSSYAVKMTRDNVIATRIYTPEDIERERPNMIEGTAVAAS